MARHVLGSSFTRGFVLTLLVLSFALILLGPTTGWAQGGGDPNAQSLVAGDGNQPPRSDSPRYPVPIAAPAQADGLLSNREVNASSGPSVLGSDSPRYPAQLPAPAESGAPLSNANATRPGNAPSFSEGSGMPASGGASSMVAAGYTSPLVIPAADFRSDGLAPGGYTFIFVTGYMVGSTGNCVMAPAYLPNGATVYQFWASAYDNDPANDLGVELHRVNNYNGAQNVMASVTTTGQSGAIQSLSDYVITNPLVVYPDYSYYVTACLNTSNLRIYSARVWYTGP
jgi:hypothetical protein